MKVIVTKAAKSELTSNHFGITITRHPNDSDYIRIITPNSTIAIPAMTFSDFVDQCDEFNEYLTIEAYNESDMSLKCLYSDS
jgi:hypothetical protein